MKLFPTFDEVFYQIDDIYKMLFFPLLTVDLNTLNKGNGKVHFVSVFGNGNPNLSFHDKHLFDFDNIRFDWNGERYHFQGDLSTIEDFDNIPSWYDEAVQEYAQFKDEYCRLKNWEEAKLSNFRIQAEKRQKKSFNYFYYINSMINYWVTRDKYLEMGCFIQGSAYLESSSDHEREIIQELDNNATSNYIGCIGGYNYVDSGEDAIHLFIDRENNQVYEQFDWT